MAIPKKSNASTISGRIRKVKSTTNSMPSRPSKYYLGVELPSYATFEDENEAPPAPLPFLHQAGCICARCDNSPYAWPVSGTEDDEPPTNVPVVKTKKTIKSASKKSDAVPKTKGVRNRDAKMSENKPVAEKKVCAKRKPYVLSEIPRNPPMPRRRKLVCLKPITPVEFYN